MLQNNQVIGTVTRGSYTVPSNSTQEIRIDSDHALIFHITDNIDTSSNITLRVSVESASVATTFSMGTLSQTFSILVTN